MSQSTLAALALPELERADPHMFLEEVVEMGGLSKAQRVRNFRHIPGAVFQQHSGFLQNAFSNDLRSRLIGDCFYSPVQVIDMHIELLRKFRSGPQVKLRMIFIDRELTFE